MTQLLPDITRYVRRPEASTIEAVQFDGTDDHAAQILRWCNDATITAHNDGPGWTITVEDHSAPGTFMTARKGDWVAKGALGQTYTLPDDIFQATYQTDATPPAPIDI